MANIEIVEVFQNIAKQATPATLATGDTITFPSNGCLVFMEAGGTQSINVTLSAQKDSKGWEQPLTFQIPADGFYVLGGLSGEYNWSGKIETVITGTGTCKVLPMAML